MLTNRTAFGLLLFLLAFLAAPAAMPAQDASAGNNAAAEEMVPGIQLPSNPATDVARYYEGLTGKTLILDSQSGGGPNLSIVVQRPIPKKEAIALIESALILNGYAIVNVDDKTAKLLGPSKPPRMEAIPLYSDASQLPAGEEIVSYFMPFRYLKVEDAWNAFRSRAPMPSSSRSRPRSSGG
jgi:hypothetical protein